MNGLGRTRSQLVLSGLNDNGGFFPMGGLVMK